MATLRSTQPHFVRCIIPNELKQAGEYLAYHLLFQNLHQLYLENMHDQFFTA